MGAIAKFRLKGSFGSPFFFFLLLFSGVGGCHRRVLTQFGSPFFLVSSGQSWAPSPSIGRRGASVPPFFYLLFLV